MRVVIEFYRTRETDDAHAIVGRETREAVDLDEAIAIARQLARTLAMPQRPDAVTIADEQGATLHSGVLDADNNQKDDDHDPGVPEREPQL